MEAENPFHDAAAAGAADDAARKADWERQVKEWEEHVAACEEIMCLGIMTRMELPAEAAKMAGHAVELSGIERTETVTGVVHLRAKLVLESGTERTAQLEFIGSPKSMVIAAEAGRERSRKRWRKIAMTAEEMSAHADRILAEFLAWRP